VKRDSGDWDVREGTSEGGERYRKRRRSKRRRRRRRREENERVNPLLVYCAVSPALFLSFFLF
jgi:hypothetical protein